MVGFTNRHLHWLSNKHSIRYIKHIHVPLWCHSTCKYKLASLSFSFDFFEYFKVNVINDTGLENCVDNRFKHELKYKGNMARKLDYVYL